MLRKAMDSRLPSVVIVLSTFNGERYLDEQMASLLSQTYGNIDVLVRDDGSSDGTTQILGRIARENRNVHVQVGENIGVVASFLELLRMVPAHAGFVALCDQDDVWRDEKIERAVGLLSKLDSSKPAMYCGAVEVVDGDLNPIRIERQATRPALFGNALVQNVATGCTTVINKAALDKVTSKHVVASKIGMHDWWLYQVISAFGQVVFDDTPMILYRQHGENVIGNASGVRFWVNRLKRQFGPHSKTISRQASEFLRVYGDDLAADDRALVQEFLARTQASSAWKRLTYAFRTPVFRQRRIDNIVMRAMIVLARI